MTNNEQIESLQAMIAYLSSKKKAEKFDVILLNNWKRSIDLIKQNNDNKGEVRRQ